MNQERLIQVASRSLALEGYESPAEITLVLTDDREIHELNRDYRGIDKPTDVLSFSQLEGEPMIGEGLLGDVVISVETAKRQAEARGESLADELDLLTAHGVLHLLGYNDETDEEAEEMRTREKKILKNG
ncbi:MAG: rRNA maturation RNase YbeY [Armatimonadota bacterium]